jgi:biopolymer transport protein ExbD
MIVTERFIIPKLGKYYFDEEEPSQEYVPSKKERKGVIISLLSTSIVTIILVYCLIKGLPFSGLFLDLSQNSYVDMLFGEGSYFYQGAVTIFSFMLIFSSIMYGIRVKTIDDNRDMERPNEFQIWMRAIYNVAENNKDMGNDAFASALRKSGEGIAVKADKDTPYSTIHNVLDNLQTLKLNKFSLMTALKTEED